MLKTLSVIREFLVQSLEIMVMTITAALVLDVVWQVITRFVLTSPSTWTEELATMLIIWVSLLGASVGFVRKSHLGVDYFVNKLPDKPRAAVEIIAYLFIGLFAAGVLMYGGYQLVHRTLTYGQPSPALGIQMGYVYLVLPISGFFILFFSIEIIVEKMVLLLKK
jgi:TRAP-type C4-dicarboxylate transport system permease small subunit